MAIRTFDELLGDHAGRIARLERRLSKVGSGSGGSTIVQSVPMVSGTVTAAQNTAATARINFPPGYFSAPPVVTVSLNAYKANADVLATNITKDYFEYITYNTTSGGDLTGVAFSWRATAAGSGGSANVQSPALPDPVTKFSTGDSNPINWTAAVWGTLSGMTYTYILDHPMWVLADFGAQITGSAAAYGMIGVAASGALSLPPETDQVTGAISKYGLAPFNTLGNANQHGTKVFLLPVGTTTLSMQARRSTANFTPNADYPVMILTPLSWAGSPGPVKAGGGLLGVNPGSVAVTGGGSYTIVGHKINFTAVGGVSLNGIFDASMADDYVIEVRVTNFSAAAGGYFRMRANGVDLATSTYGNQQVYNDTPTTVKTTYIATTGFIWAPVGFGHSAKITAKFTNPASPGSEFRTVRIESNGQNSGAIVNGTNVGSVGAAVYDGVSFIAASGNMTGWLKVYALT